MYTHEDKPRMYINGGMIRRITASLIRNRFEPNQAFLEIMNILSGICPMAAAASENNKRNTEAEYYEVHFTKGKITKTWHF